MTSEYKNVSIPQFLNGKLEKLVATEESGYVRVSDAVKDAVRELLRKHKEGNNPRTELMVYLKTDCHISILRGCL